MATVCKIIVRAPIETVAGILDDVLDAQWPALERVDSDWPLASDRGEWCSPVDAFPTRFSLGAVGDGFAEVHYNSFAKLDALASRLSWASGGPVVVNVYQSVGTASYWALHRDGQRVRWIEAGDGIVESHGGERLAFELDEPGRPLEMDDGADEFFGFDCPEQDWYNREVGVPVEVYTQPQPQLAWINYLAKAPDADAAPRKPWWRFW